MDYIVNIISVILSALLGSILTYWFGIRHLQTELELKLKAEKYASLVKYLRGFVGRTANGSDKKEFFREWEGSWLFSSDEVFKTIDAMVKYIEDQEARKQDNFVQGKKLLGDIIISMRKDLLNKKTELSPTDFIFWEVLE